MPNKVDSQPINVARYLDALNKLPDVSPKDVAEARQVLKKVLETNLDTFVNFHRGPQKRDGKVEVVQVYKVPGRSNTQVPVVFEQSGRVYCEAKNFSQNISPTVAAYLFAGLFGDEELAPLTQVPAKNQFDPKVQISFDAREVLLKKGSGIRDLYRCVLRKGDAKACENSEGLQKYTEAQQLAQRLETERNKNIKKYVAAKEKETNQLWKSAREMVVAAKGFGAGDPDEIQKIMNGYVAFKNQKVESLDWQGAYNRWERTRQMMKRIGDSADGWPHFQQRFCKEEIIQERDCVRPEERGTGVFKTVAICDYGVATKVVSINDDCDPTAASVGKVGNLY